jgi:hypothetical protein
MTGIRLPPTVIARLDRAIQNKVTSGLDAPVKPGHDKHRDRP